VESPFKSLFPYTRDVAYLDTAAEGLPPLTSREALQEYMDNKMRGSVGRKNHYHTEEEVRVLSGQLLGCSHEDVGLLGNSSDGLNILANSLDWQAGDEVLLCDLEFPSNVLPWLQLQDKGVHVRVLRSHKGLVDFETFAANINSRTRVLAISKVSYKSGTNFPFLERLSQEVHRVGGILCVDVTQALGRVPVNLTGVDYLVASSYKWLLGTHGLGVVYIAPELRARLAVNTVGWYSVQNLFAPDRFERFQLKPGAEALVAGMPNFPAMYVMRDSMKFLLANDVEKTHERLKPLVRSSRDQLAQMGLSVLSPAESEYASGIVSFEHDSAQQIGAALEREGVIVWAGDGRVRASIHLYNTEEDVERFTSAVHRILPQLEPVHV
jgi:selenocysteine lyase/cysteine desulfurase